MHSSNFTGPQMAADPKSPSAPMALTPLLEAFIPGFSIVNELFSTVFNIDITSYLWTLVAVFALAAGVGYFKDTVLDFFQDYLISTVEIQYDDELYNYLLLWISQQKMSQRATHFIARTQVKSEMTWDSDSDEEPDEPDIDDPDDAPSDSPDAAASATKPPDPANWEHAKPLHYTPAYGTHYFTHRGRWLAVTRKRDEKALASSWRALRAEQIYLSVLGRDPSVLKSLLVDAQRAYLARDGNRTLIYRPAADGAYWARCLARPPRPMSTVVLDQAQKDTILDDMREYLRPRTRRWYACRGIPYRRGYLLHGPPGTGKTSLCFAAAGLLRLRIYAVGLNSRTLTEESLEGLFRDLPRRCIVLLEDVDAAGLSAKRGAEGVAAPVVGGVDKPEDKVGDKAPADSGPKISLSGFLNIIDGVASAEGRILVMTTNHIERLDAAMLRPGRVDRTVVFGHATPAVTAGLFRAIFASIEADGAAAPPQPNGAAPEPASATEKVPAKRPPRREYRYHHKSDAEVAEIARAFGERIPPDEFTPAEIQGYLLQHKYSPDAALAGLGAWMQSRRAEKEVQKAGL